jgi:hypothetical protein
MCLTFTESNLPYLNEDILTEILKHVPSSLNICLVNKMFFSTKTKTHQMTTKITDDTIDKVFLCKEVMRSRHVKLPVFLPFINDETTFLPLKGCVTDSMTKYIQNNYIFNELIAKNLDFFEKLHEQNAADFETISFFAAFHGKTKLLDWLCTTSYKNQLLSDHNLSIQSLKNRNMELLTWVIDKDAVLTPYATQLAVQQNWIDGLHKIVADAHGWKWHPHTITSALRFCSVDDIIWLLNHGCVWTSEDTSYAADVHRIDVLEALLYLRSDLDVVFDEKITYYILHAAQRIDQTYDLCDVLIYAYTKYGWSCEAFIPLISYYPLEMIEWAMEKGCSFHTHGTGTLYTSSVIESCVKNDRSDVLDLLKTKGSGSSCNIDAMADSYLKRVDDIETNQTWHIVLSKKKRLDPSLPFGMNDLPKLCQMKLRKANKEEKKIIVNDLIAYYNGDIDRYDSHYFVRNYDFEDDSEFYDCLCE